MLAPVLPLLHFTVPVQPVAVKVAFSVPHTLVLFDAILGAAGTLPEPITTLLLAGLAPQTFSHVAV